MATTPRKPSVHWALDVSMSDFGSPFSTASSTSEISASSLQYLNAQLVAHGFAPSPGLSLDGMAATDAERVIKCLLGMLGQRMDDMSRTEDLTTKYRTLSYDHERLLNMHRTAKEQAANAEREMNVFKSKLAAATRTIQSIENAHKQTTAELTRTRSMVQSLRQTHVAELKKRDTQVERMQEKWSKLADAQGQLTRTPSGLTLTCGNASVAYGSENAGRGKSFMEVALEQADEARARLDADNLRLRRMVTSAVNEMQGVLARMRGEDEDEVDPCTMSSLFPLHPKTAATDKLSSLFTSLRDSIANQQPQVEPTTSTSLQPPDEDISRLNGIIEQLRSELEQARKECKATAAKTQELFDQLATRNATHRDVAEVSMELMSVPAKDVELERLEAMKRELDNERQKFTEAAVKLGKERATMEAERLRFLEEKRSWQVEKILAELPPTPPATTSLPSPKKAPSPKKPGQSPRKSPAKSTNISPRKPRNARRSSVGLTPPPKKTRGKVVELASETEVIPSSKGVSSFLAPPPLGSSLLPTSFVLPPPSPNALLPASPVIAPPSIDINESDQFDLGETQPTSTEDSNLPSSSSNPILKTPPDSSSQSSQLSAPSFPYPVAKPFAKRMIHAYSPAKPSPLSRILSLADSPGSPTSPGQAISSSDSSGQLGVVVEEDEEDDLFPRIDPAPQPQMSLAAELGIAESDEEEEKTRMGRESPLMDMQVDSHPPTKKKVALHPNPQRSRVDKGKGVATVTTTRRTVEKEKENKNTAESSKARLKDKKRAPAGPPGTDTERPTKVVKVTKSTPGVSRPDIVKKVAAKPSGSTSARTNAADSKKASSSSRTVSQVRPVAGGRSTGPRRVLIDSAEAPPMAKSRKS
ncbi:hypothetical protein PLEOSDRAFT_159560 [Pleurotus ostreatus PC15]|uniref:Afadin and alpha-actinin-binding-domain-containing protein n=1 Tax=Pleurotus ostreatus (strain PC15) TaxID=1137138 RepID=A0A067NEQ5_PLEO1|nr:hypothetical protein PLEOSDRAFT_159560 [Pleurotus ostreatus PC15]